MTAAPAARTWAENIQAVHEEAAELMQLDIVHQSQVPEMAFAALAGDRDALRLLQQIAQFLAQVERAPRRNPALCVSCPRPLRKGRFLCGVATPARDDAQQGLGIGICEHCASDAETARPKVMAAMRRTWPSAETVDITHPAGGRA